MDVNSDKTNHALYLHCNLQGEVFNVLIDDNKIIDIEKLPISFDSIIDKGSMVKAYEFWKVIRDQKFVSSYELNIENGNQEPLALQFSGGIVGDMVWVIAASHNETLEKMLNELMHMNNEQQNLIRANQKELSNVKMKDLAEFDLFDEISRVNNELINTQRKLVKQNKEILLLNKKLSDSNKEIEHFAYTVSHDLKEPLRMVKSFMELLKKNYESQLDDKAHQYIYYAIDGAERMDRFITDLLEFSRVGRFNSVMEFNDLNEILENVIKLNNSLIDGLNAEIFYPKMPVVRCQRMAIQQLFHNLIGNCLKFRRTGISPEITIKINEKQGHWVFSIKDNGRGIAPEHHKVIFDLFRRIEEEGDVKGTGMGLAICKKIVEQHGGEIWVESELGSGSTFYFTLEKKRVIENK